MHSFYYHNLDPILFKIGNFVLTWYWFTYLFGFWIIYFLVLKLQKQNLTNFSKNKIIDLMIIGWIGLILGARIGYAFMYNADLFIKNPDYFYKIWMGGMSFHGALIGFIIAMLLYSLIKKVNFFEISDLFAIPTPLALGFGRLANFINGELWGRPTDVPWAVVFPFVDNQPRHPSQIYQAFLEGFLLFAILWLLRRKLKIKGVVSSMFLVGYGGFRFIIEFFREPDRQVGYLFNLFTLGQLLCFENIVSKSESSLSKIHWVSGSPKRTLYSNNLGVLFSIMSPA